MRVPSRCDVVVIGGGPAGSMAATFLAQQGYDVVLFDRECHPRYRVGESVIPHLWKYCDLAGATDQIEAEGFVRKAGGTVAWEGVIRQFAFKDFGHTRPALHVERDRFDYILLQNARAHGAQVFEAVSVAHADLDRDDGATVAYRGMDDETRGAIACRFVVDASGQHAVLARQLGIRVIDEDFRFMSVWGYFTDSKYVGADGRAHPFEALSVVPPTTFVSSIGRWGWVWHIPLRESTSVGLVLPQAEIKRAKAAGESWEEFFIRTCYEVPHLNRLLEHARLCTGSVRLIRDYSYRPTQLAGPGFFLIGDAAAFVDPIFSVGVCVGMYSAWLAAWAIDRTFKAPARADAHRALFSDQLRGRLEVARAIALPRYRPGGAAGDLARAAIRFESSLEQELIHVVSTVTTRNENFVDVAGDANGEMMVSDKYRTLETIAF